MMINSTITNDTLSSDYDDNGAIIYTTVTLLFYSLSLFCSLILHIDPNDNYHEIQWNIQRHSKNRRTFHSSKADILNALADQSLRQKYWRIYYGEDKYESQSHEFRSAESKRLSLVSQLVKELNNEQTKQSSKHRELDELNRITTRPSSLQPSPDLLPTSFLLKFRRSRSVSAPGAGDAECPTDRRSSFDLLCQTPLCKPPIITLTKYA